MYQCDEFIGAYKTGGYRSVRMHECLTWLGAVVEAIFYFLFSDEADAVEVSNKDNGKLVLSWKRWWRKNKWN